MLCERQTMVTWSHLQVKIKDRTILSDCSGYCNPGQMLTIMGPSGSGKTTLLSMLCHKCDSHLAQSGTVLANKNAFTSESFYNFGAYVYQNDLLFENLTVYQTLYFIATLKNKSEERIQELISAFQLQKCRNTYVGGNIKKGISGGEKKRVSIAVEMVSDPSVLILDEPTSGLDSHKAERIMRILKKQAANNKTIIFTMHQPSHLLYSLLDRLLLLHKGQTLYQGSATGIVDYMSKFNLILPKNCTVSDFFMYEVSKEATGLNNQNYKKTQQIIPSSELEGIPQSKVQVSFVTMLRMLLWRQWTIYKRSPMKIGSMFMNVFVSILIVGLIFLNGIASAQNLLFEPDNAIPLLLTSLRVCFINVTSIIMTNVFSVTLTFPVERDIFTKEKASKSYYTLAYFLPKIAIQVGNAAIGTILSSSVVYWINGFEHSFQQFILYIVTLFLISLVGNSLGLLTGSVFQDAKQASALSPMFLLPLMMFSGLYNSLKSIPDWIGWLQYISPFKYGIHMLMVNQYKDLIIPTSNGDLDYKQFFGINMSFTSNVFVLLALSGLFYTLSFVFLKAFRSNISV